MRVPQHASLAAVIAMALAAACSDTPVEPKVAQTPEIAGPSFAKVPKTTAVVNPIVGGAPDFGTDVGDSRINRTTNGINVNLQTTELTPGYTYTLWAVIFNDGDATNGPPDAVRFVDGKVVGPSGEATFSGSIKANDEDPGSPPPPFGVLTHPVRAEVHLVVRCHGPKDPEFMPDQINSFEGGCTSGSSGGLGDGPNECQDVQVAIHPDAS